MTDDRVEALVVGGGLVGLAAAASLARAGLTTLHLAPKAPPDRRTSALMRPAVDFLRGAGLIPSPETVGVPLTDIRIIDATDRLIRAPETLFSASDAGLEAFGWNFSNLRLAECFAAATKGLANLRTAETALTSLRREGDGWSATLGDGRTIEAQLVVGADGRKSSVRDAAGLTSRERRFSESALVCDLDLGHPLGGTSVEFHYPHGPFTLVPAGGDRANLVWIDEPAVLESARTLPPDTLNALLRKKSQRLFGTIAATKSAQVFPLGTLTVDRAGKGGVALAGESAHAFPPIGAQGLNLGLRDVADLAATVGSFDRSVAGWAVGASDDYANRRAGDLSRTGAMVDMLFRSLLAEVLPAQALRAGGLWALRSMPVLRKRAFSLGMGQR